MFKNQMSNQQFKSFIKKNLIEYYDKSNFYDYITSKVNIIHKIYITDLTAVRTILLDTFQPRGQKPWDPICLFRTYWLICQYGSGSISQWIETLKNPFWAILSGFTPGDIPGIGTLYDFEKRILDFDMGQRSKRLQKKYNFNRKPTQKLKKNQKQKPKKAGIVKNM
ncbi:MAG TPA: hypothetical protein VKN64_06405, partial [Halanaerobiales bacterium]|nr:hypothetical protein [Halanaerobiales bacterium]